MAGFSKLPNVFELIIDRINDWLKFGFPWKGKGANGSTWRMMTISDMRSTRYAVQFNLVKCGRIERKTLRH